MSKSNPEKRIWLLVFIFVSIGLLIWGRFFYLMIIRRDYYIAKATHLSGDTAVAARGSIFLTDKDGIPYAAALNKEFSLIYAVPEKIKDPAATAKTLSPILGIDEQALLQKLSKPKDAYEILAKKVSDGVVNAIKSLGDSAIGVDSETARYYPSDLYLSQAIGFLGFGKNGQAGQYGLEENYNAELSGPVSSSDLVLTVDSAIQAQAGALIAAAVQKWRATGGSIIVMNPKNGDIVAMASYPNFDANDYAAVPDQNIFVNPDTLKRFEPGSVFKPLTMAIGLETGAVTPETKFLNTGTVKVDDRTISNALPTEMLGWQTMPVVLEQSLNTGAVFVEQKVPKDIFLKYLKNFGADDKTGIDVREISGDLSVLSSMRNVNFATASFGQGVALTPVELIRALAAIANGGKLVRPHLVAKIISRGGEERQMRGDEGSRVISPETAAKVVSMMVDVVEKGSGRRAAVSGYSIAGKTGTAQIPDLKTHKYNPDENIHTFIGFAPAYDPKFIALVKIDKPKGIRFAESTAVPVFHDLAQFIFNYWSIPPDRPVAPAAQ